MRARVVAAANRSIAACVFVAVLVGCATPYRGGPRTVYLVDHGWHTGIVLPWTDHVASAWPAGLHVGTARYVELGWGERKFYPAAHNSSGAALRALFWRNDSVLHLVALDRPAAQYFAPAETLALALDDAGFQRLIEAVGASFERDADGRALAVGVGLYGDSRFYLSRERYHLLNTCNVWTADKLVAAGLPVAPWRAITTGMLWRQVRSLGIISAASTSYGSSVNAVSEVVCGMGWGCYAP